jgi:eukaryotic-like serine/threonine-protein kinase
MTTRDRWQRIKAIFYSAQACAPAERPGFLKEACGGDGLIQQEVESLLAADDTNESFLEEPAFEFIAGILAYEGSELSAGQPVGPYTILSSLGTGGMGDVYLAQDVRLGRRIALKLISSEFAKDERRVKRFEQEARAASALNHPNVCVIHEVGTTENGRHFIAMEHIDGITLRDRMARRRLTPAEALDVAIQVAAALAAAHTAGIIHRDIKPENIMLRRDGYIKVLDFGLAKLNENLLLSSDIHEVSTLATMHTEPGMLIGTVKYMSPEHLRELPVDERTDIWSLGVVLHEMLTGTTPFDAPKKNEMIALILKREPPELMLSKALSAEFHQVINKALSKDRDERYRTVKELASDLKKLRRQLRAQYEIEVTPELLARSTLDLGLAHDERQEIIHRGSGSSVFFKIKSQALSTAEYLLSEIREHKAAAAFTGVTAVFLILLVVGLEPVRSRVAAWFAVQPRTQLQAPNIEPLTNAGKSVCAAVSPDGKNVAYAEEKDGLQQLLIMSRVTLGSSEIVPLADVQYRSVTFSRDGYYLFFTRTEKNEVGALYQVALPGGTPRKIKEGVDSPISFSPNGDKFAFVRFNRAGGEYYLMTAPVDGSDEHVLATRRDGNRFSVDGPAWSPDGNSIVCGAGWWSNGYHMNLVEFSVENGRERAVGEQLWFLVQQVAWLNDKSGLIVGGRDHPVSPSQLWHIAYPSGQLTRITNSTSDYDGVSVSNDGSEIVTMQKQYLSKIWVAPDGDAERARAIAPKVGFSWGLSWTSRGKIVYSSMVGNNLNVSLVNSDGSDKKQLTVNSGDNYSPQATPDGRFILFTSNRTGGFNIWRMNSEDGSDPRQLTFSDGNFYPSCSPDGQWVLYDNQSNSTLTIWKVFINGGESVRLTDEYARMPVVSPDSQFIACRYYVANGVRGIAIVPLAGGRPVKLLPIPIMDWQRVQWISQGHALSYIDTTNGVSNIWSYDLDTGSRKQLTNFKTEQIFSYAWSPDYTQLACERGMKVSDVALVKK